MLFADIDLAARIERSECRMLIDAAAVASQRRPNTGVMALEVAGGVASYGGPDSPLNKLAGLGFDGPINASDLAEIERAFAERKTPVQAEVSILADASVCATLTDRGYQLQNFENVLGRQLPIESTPPVTEDIEISLDEGEDFDTWLDVLVEGFASPDTQGVPSHDDFPREVIGQAISDMATAEGVYRYLAHRQGVLAGAARMSRHDGVATLSGAATLPEHRRRGVQSALLWHRLTDAARQGCDLAVVTTQPGSKSQQNAQRQGFELLYTRAILVLG